MKKLIPLFVLMLLVLTACQSTDKPVDRGEGETQESNQNFGTKTHEDSLRHTPVK